MSQYFIVRVPGEIDGFLGQPSEATDVVIVYDRRRAYPFHSEEVAARVKKRIPGAESWVIEPR